MSTFQEKVAVAQATGQEWVETSREIMETMMPRLGSAKYFCYHGVKVCEFGKVEEIEAECNLPINERLHGKEEATVVSGR